MITPPITLITHAIVAVAAAAGAWAYQNHRYAAQLAEVRLDYSKRDFTALEAQYADTIRLQKKAEDAQAKAAVRIRTLAADRDLLRGAVDGLRGDLARYRAEREPVPGDPVSPGAGYTSALETVFGDCAAEVGRMASLAQGHANDTQTLTEAWPK